MNPKTLDEKLNEGRQYRNTMEIRALDQEEENGQIVEGYATTFNEPYELYRFMWEGKLYILMEQVDPNAFAECDMDDVIMQYNHEGRVFARRSNGTLGLETDEHGLKIRADLSGTQIGRQLYEEINGGYTTKMSFGFTISKDVRTVVEEEDKTIDTRTILGIRKLYDVSAVSLPANNATEISARSYVDGLIAELTEERRKREEIERQKQKIRIMLDL